MGTTDASSPPLLPRPEEEIAGVEVNPAGLLPQNTSYYTYMGTVTAPPCHGASNTPPCTEGVTWFVLKTPEDISAEQISTFAKALSARCPGRFSHSMDAF